MHSGRAVFEQLVEWIQNLQLLDRQNVHGVAMHHAVAISTQGTKVGRRVDQALAALGKRFEVVNLYVRACILQGPSQETPQGKHREFEATVSASGGCCR